MNKVQSQQVLPLIVGESLRAAQAAEEEANDQDVLRQVQGIPDKLTPPQLQTTDDTVVKV